MKGNELRIGNLVSNGVSNIDGYAEILTITNTDKYFCDLKYCSDRYHVIDGNAGALVNELKPIPLTEEWLLKLGFKETGEKWFSKGVIILGYITTEDNLQTEYCTPTGNWTTIDIKYVHQLQNLYWCLCGEELQINNNITK